MSECKIHFLNVLNGDCTIIEHETGRISVIDICNGNVPSASQSVEANYNRQNNSTNPIDYLLDICENNSVFRFILTHPDMDHMDGIKKLFYNFHPINFCDTNHEKDLSKEGFENYEENDWEFYKNIRQSQNNPKTLHLHEGNKGEYYTNDGFEIISPNKKLVEKLKKSNNPDWNEISYVILHNVYNRKILYCGDSGNKAWKNIMEDENLLDKIRDIDILLAPHHGRKTGGDDLNKYLNQLNPKLAILGNTENSEHKNYSAFYNRRIPILTNNEAGDIIVTVEKHVEINNNIYGNIYIEMSKNNWNNLLKTKKENWKDLPKENKIHLN